MHELNRLPGSLLRPEMACFKMVEYSLNKCEEQILQRSGTFIVLYPPTPISKDWFWLTCVINCLGWTAGWVTGVLHYFLIISWPILGIFSYLYFLAFQFYFTYSFRQYFNQIFLGHFVSTFQVNPRYFSPYHQYFYSRFLWWAFGVQFSYFREPTTQHRYIVSYTNLQPLEAVWRAKIESFRTFIILDKRWRVGEAGLINEMHI